MSEDEEAAILNEVVLGRSERDVARSHHTTQAEVHRIMKLEAERLFSGEGARQEMLIEATRLMYFKTQLWARAMEGDLPAGALLVKVSERLSSMMGWSHPHGHVVTIAGTIEPAEQPTSTRRMLEAIRALRNEPPGSDDEEPDPLN